MLLLLRAFLFRQTFNVTLSKIVYNVPNLEVTLYSLDFVTIRLSERTENKLIYMYLTIVTISCESRRLDVNKAVNFILPFHFRKMYNMKPKYITVMSII